jgi:hemerythrin-like domain-containing protein
MTEHKTMNTIVHAAFRRDLARFDAALAAFPTGSRSRADGLKRAWDWLASELHHHHDYEEEYFWPALHQTDADLSVISELDGEHHAMRSALEGADTAMRTFHDNPFPAETSAARTAVAHLKDVLLAHLAHEERDLEPISAQYASAPVMKAAVKKVIKAHRGRLGGVLAWLQDGADADARRGLRHEIPAPVVVIVSGVGGRRYRRDIASVWS